MTPRCWLAALVLLAALALVHGCDRLLRKPICGGLFGDSPDQRTLCLNSR